MKNFIKTIKYRNFFNGTLVFIIASSLIVSNNYPQVVRAESNFMITDPITFTLQKNETIAQKLPKSNDREAIKTMWVVITAYSSTVDQTDSTPCHTANNFDLCTYYDEYSDYNSIAGNGFMFNTEVRMPEIFGDKVFVVRDRMNKRYTYGRMDIWLPTRAEAIEFGVKRVKMEIYN
ncbi:MAG: 3D domain-containing protein [Candidatus Magasanikbacteria bacterium]|nr:3D domain-containing protein [Candidatus Magasanikbacteria bacterium]